MFKYIALVFAALSMACATTSTTDQERVIHPLQCEDDDAVLFRTMTPNGWQVRDTASFSCSGGSYKRVQFVDPGQPLFEESRLITIEGFRARSDAYAMLYNYVNMARASGCSFDTQCYQDCDQRLPIDLLCTGPDGSDQYRSYRVYPLGHDGRVILVSGHLADDSPTEITSLINAFEKFRTWTVYSDENEPYARPITLYPRK